MRDDINSTVIGADDGYEYGDQLFAGKQRPAPGDMDPIQTDDHKPIGGLWTSTYLGRPELSNWVEWCADEDFTVEGEKTWVLGVTQGSKLAVIDSEPDYRALVEEYPAIYRNNERVPDYGEIQHDYDGVWLTKKGQRETVYIPDENFRGLYGWDVESTVWFDWRFSGVEPLGEIEWDEHPRNSAVAGD